MRFYLNKYGNRKITSSFCICYPQHSLENYHAHKIQSFMQSLMTVVESALHYVYCPLGGLVMLAALWNKAFQQFSQRVHMYELQVNKHHNYLYTFSALPKSDSREC